jgi:3,4-dihydroxy-2-butanone 4-phosphate synthase
VNGLFGWANALAFQLGGESVRWSDLLGNLLGLATVALAIRRSLWAWPVQITGAVLLFGASLSVHLGGNAARQIVVVAAASYGWWRWNRQRGAAHPQGVTIRWATGRERLALLGFPGRRHPRLRLAALGHPLLLGPAARRLHLRRVAGRHPVPGARLGRVLVRLDRGGRRRRAARLPQRTAGLRLHLRDLLRPGHRRDAAVDPARPHRSVVSVVPPDRCRVGSRQRRSARMNGTLEATATGLDSIETALLEIAAGRPVVVVDDEDRENEGDIIFAAEHATQELLAFTVRYSSGVICVSMDEERADKLELPPMTAVNQDRKGTAFTVSVDAREGISTGISAADRAHTIRLLSGPSTTADELTRPGHVFPLRARPGGVIERPGHTEAGVDLARMAGLTPVGVLVEIVNDDGTMARLPELRVFARQHGLALISIADLIAYRTAHRV